MGFIHLLFPVVIVGKGGETIKSLQVSSKLFALFVLFHFLLLFGRVVASFSIHLLTPNPNSAESKH